MILRQSNHRKISLTLGALLLLFFSTVFFARPTFATNSTGLKAYSQGATLTEKYFVYTTCSGNCSTFSIHRCDRPGFNNCKTLGSYSKKPSSMYHKWGTNYAQVITKENGSMYCFQLNPFKKVANSKCGGMMKSSGLGAGTQAYRQGWAKYGNCYLRGYGNNSGMKNYIHLYNSKKKKIDQWGVPQSGGEIEDVMSDGSGQIWYTYALNYSSLTYHKMSKTTSDKWAQKCKPTASNSSSSSSSTNRTNSKSAAREKTASDYQKDSYTPSVSTYDGVVSTIFFGTIQDDGEGCGVYTVLDLVMTILTIGIGISALIGITISGITYLTAGSNVAKTTKAKRRIYEIVIGLAAYAAIWGILTFLLPEFNPELKACKTLTVEEIAARDAENATKKQTNQQSNQQSSPSSNPNLNTQCMSSALPQIRDSICQLDTASERIARTAELLAIPYGKKNSQNRFTKPKKWSQINGAKPPTYFQNAYDKYGKGHWSLYSKKYGNVTRVGASCDVFVATVLKSSGYAKPKGFAHSAIRSKLKDKSKWKVVKKAKRGDVCQNGDKHIRIYLGDGKVAEAQSGVSSGVSRFGHIADGGCSGYTIYRAIK